MEIVLYIIGILVIIFIIRTLIYFGAQIAGFVFGLLEENFLKIIGLALIGYGIQYITNRFWGVDSFLGVYILFYPIIIAIIYYCLTNASILFRSLIKMFVDSMSSSSSNKNYDNKKQNNFPYQRIGGRDGWQYYQHEDYLEGVDKNGISHSFHLDGDGVWRDFNGNSVKDNTLWPK